MAEHQSGQSITQTDCGEDAEPGQQEGDTGDHTNHQNDDTGLAHLETGDGVSTRQTDDQGKDGSQNCDSKAVPGVAQEVVLSDNADEVLQSRDEVEQTLVCVDDGLVRLEGSQQHPQDGEDRDEQYSVNQNVCKDGADFTFRLNTH